MTFSIAGGELTPTWKLKRDVVLRTFQEQVDALFSEDRTPAGDAVQEVLRTIDGGLDHAIDVA